MTKLNNFYSVVGFGEDCFGNTNNYMVKSYLNGRQWGVNIDAFVDDCHFPVKIGARKRAEVYAEYLRGECEWSKVMPTWYCEHCRDNHNTSGCEHCKFPPKTFEDPGLPVWEEKEEHPDCPF